MRESMFRVIVAAPGCEHISPSVRKENIITAYSWIFYTVKPAQKTPKRKKMSFIQHILKIQCASH